VQGKTVVVEVDWAVVGGERVMVMVNWSGRSHCDLTVLARTVGWKEKRCQAG
jgi:hypothetical protein